MFCSLKGRVTLSSPAPGAATPPPTLTALGLAPSAAVTIDGVAAAVPEGGWGAGAAGGCVEVAWDGRQQQVLVKVGVSGQGRGLTASISFPCT
jgi:hypothetical protein